VSRANLEGELAGSAAPGVHPSPADLERFMRNELEEDERQAVNRHLVTGCEKCCAITGRLWDQGTRRRPFSLIEMLATPEVRLAGRRRRGRPKKWDPRMSAAVASLESVAQELLREYAHELEGFRDRLEILAASLFRVPAGDPERVSIAEQLQTVIACVIQDTLRQAIADLHAAADLAPEPGEKEAETA
jgi:hypothetical protein